MFGKEKAIAVLNHKSQLDWVMSWVVSDHCNILEVKLLCFNSIYRVLHAKFLFYSFGSFSSFTNWRDPSPLLQPRHTLQKLQRCQVTGNLR